MQKYAHRLQPRVTGLGELGLRAARTGSTRPQGTQEIFSLLPPGTANRVLMSKAETRKGENNVDQAETERQREPEA